MALMARMRRAPEDRWRVKAACLRLLAGAPLSGAQRRLIGQCVDIYLPLNAHDEQALAAEVARLPGAAKEVVMELITGWERKGRAEGLREGRAEGLREGLREGQRLVVERMLTRRFGALPLLRGVGFWEVPSFPLSFRASGCPNSPSPLVGEGGWGDEGQTCTGMQKVTFSPCDQRSISMPRLRRSASRSASCATAMS